MLSQAIHPPDPRPPAPIHDLDQVIWELAQLATNAANDLENLLSTFQTASSVHGRDTVLSRLPPAIGKLVLTAGDVARHLPPGKALTHRALAEVKHAAGCWGINPGQIIGFFLNVSQAFTILLNRLSKVTGWDQAVTYLKRAKAQRTQIVSRGLSNTTNWLPRDVEVAIRLATESQEGAEEEPAEAAAQTTTRAATRTSSEASRSLPSTPATNLLSTRPAPTPAPAPALERVDFTAADTDTYHLPNGCSCDDYEDEYDAAMPDAHDDSGYQSSPSAAGSPQSPSFKNTGMGTPSANTRKRSAPASASASKRLKAAHAQPDGQDNPKTPKTPFSAFKTSLQPHTTSSSVTGSSVAQPLSSAPTLGADTGPPPAPDPSEPALLGALMDQQWGEGSVIRDALHFIVSVRHNTFAVEPLLLGTERKEWRLGVANIDTMDEDLVLLCPIRCEDHHWVLIEARPGTRTARIYDSRSDCPTVQSAVDDTLSRLDVLLHTRTPESSWDVAREACAQQMHERDDSIAIIANAFCTLSETGPESTLDSRAWRHTVAVLLGAMDDNDVADRFDQQMKDLTFERMMDQKMSESPPAVPPLKNAADYIKQLHEHVQAVKKEGLSAANAKQSLLRQHLANVTSQRSIIQKLVDLGKGTVKDLSAQNACINKQIEEAWEALGRARENPDAEWTDGTGQSLDQLIPERQKKSRAIHETMKVFARLECVLESLNSRAERYESVAEEVKVYKMSLEEA